MECQLQTQLATLWCESEGAAEGFVESDGVSDAVWRSVTCREGKVVLTIGVATYFAEIAGAAVGVGVAIKVDA